MASPPPAPNPAAASWPQMSMPDLPLPAPDPNWLIDPTTSERPALVREEEQRVEDDEV